MPTRQPGEGNLSAQAASPCISAAKDKVVGVGFRLAAGSGGGISQKSTQNTPVVQGSMAVAAVSVSRSWGMDGEVEDEANRTLHRLASGTYDPKVKTKGKALQPTK